MMHRILEPWAARPKYEQQQLVKSTGTRVGEVMAEATATTATTAGAAAVEATAAEVMAVEGSVAIATADEATDVEVTVTDVTVAGRTVGASAVAATPSASNFHKSARMKRQGYDDLSPASHDDSHKRQRTLTLRQQLSTF